MNIKKIVRELKRERARLDRAIAALDGRGSTSVRAKAVTSSAPAGKKNSGHALTPEGRRRLSLAMKRRWAERRKKGLKRP